MDLMRKATIAKLKDVEAINLEVQAQALSMMEKALQMGEMLTEVKEECQRGEFMDLIKEHTTVGDRQARKYMQIYKHRDKIPNGPEGHLVTINGFLESIATGRSLDQMMEDDGVEEATPEELAAALAEHDPIYAKELQIEENERRLEELEADSVIRQAQSERVMDEMEAMGHIKPRHRRQPEEDRHEPNDAVGKARVKAARANLKHEIERWGALTSEAIHLTAVPTTQDGGIPGEEQLFNLVCRELFVPRHRDRIWPEDYEEIQNTIDDMIAWHRAMEPIIERLSEMEITIPYGKTKEA